MNCICKYFSLILLVSLLGCSCSQSESESSRHRAQLLARCVFYNMEFTGNRYLRLITDEPLSERDTVHVETDASLKFKWRVPSSGYLVRLHEFPNRHEPRRRLHNIVYFVFPDKTITNLVSEVNTSSIDVIISGPKSNVEWVTF